MEIDEAKRAALGRLTGNERDCLRRRLRHQTAKEMAIDLGVSPHAVEKRLKMARTKLGLSSSLDAARLLDAAERYGPTVPRTADLAVAGKPAQFPDGDVASPASRNGVAGWTAFAIGMGVLVMVVTFLMVLLASSAPTQVASPARAPVRPAAYRTAPPDEIRAFVASTFRTMDRDGSGFIEAREAPDRIGIGRPFAPGTTPADDGKTWITGRQAQAMWIARADRDGDGRVSAGEYMAVTYPVFAARGVPVNWRPAER